MAKLGNKTKDNPRLEQRMLADGQISLYLEYYLGRESEPVLDQYGEPVLYDRGMMAGKPKYKVRHIRRKENLNLYLVAKPKSPIDRNHNRETLQLAKKIRQEKEQELLEQENGYRLDGFFSRRVCGMAGEGYRYACRPGDTDQEIETVLIKKGSVVYSLNCIGRPENRQANQALFDAILDGMQANLHQS